MSVAAPIQSTTPDDRGRVFEAVADALASAGGYVDIAMRSTELRDARALAYALRAATASLITAAEMTAELRPSNQRRARP